MNRKELQEVLKEKVLVLDGAYGTELSKRGYSDVPEKVVLENPGAVMQLHEEYVRAGADVILTSTFGANRRKLEKFGLADKQRKIVENAVKVAKKAAKNKIVFGDIGPTGELPKPMGSMTFDDYVDIFKELAEMLLHQGVDAIILETFTDILELKAAVLAVRELSKDVFLAAHLTFDENARTLTGTDPMNFAITFEDLDVDAIGTNCSLGPQDILPIFEELSRYSNKFLIVEPDAGSPVLKGGKVTYPVKAEEFAFYVDSFWEAKANIIGSCCGSDPTYTQAISRKVGRRAPIFENGKKVYAFSSPSSIIDFSDFVVIGERINPAGRKKLQDAMKSADLPYVLKIASSQKKAGANALDVNFGIEKLVSNAFMVEAITSIAYSVGTPLSLDIQSLDSLREAMKRYPARPLINSSRAEESELRKKLGLLKRYGGMLVVLAMEESVPNTFEERKNAIEKALSIVEGEGVNVSRIVFDPIILAVGAGASPKETLKTIDYLNSKGLKSVVGLSNISFGMPDRSFLNAAFLSTAIFNDLSAAILNPKDEIVMKSLNATLILNGKSLEINVNGAASLVEYILDGNENKLLELVDEFLKNKSPLNVIEEDLKPAMDVIGEMYNDGRIFLPQLILAAQTAQKAFEKVQSMFTEKKSNEKFIIATVKGDVHDIGKNIVATILKSAGYAVVDLGRNVPTQKIVEAVIRERPVMLGLSAMMTTTAPKIKETIDALKKRHVNVPVVVGGASLNEEVAHEFGADFYAKNATDALKYLEAVKRK